MAHCVHVHMHAMNTICAFFLQSSNFKVDLRQFEIRFKLESEAEAGQKEAREKSVAMGGEKPTAEAEEKQAEDMGHIYSCLAKQSTKAAAEKKSGESAQNNQVQEQLCMQGVKGAHTAQLPTKLHAQLPPIVANPPGLARILPVFLV